VGKLSPNFLLIGFQEKWMTTSYQASQDYFRTLQTAFDQRLAVGILRIRNGLKVEKAGIQNLAFQKDSQGILSYDFKHNAK
jgi:hypothetical protein